MPRALFLLLPLVVACGAKEPAAAKAPSPSDPSGAANGPVASSSAATPEPAEAAPSPRKHRPLEIYSRCGDVVTVVFADDPKAPSVGKRAIAPSSAIDGPRDDNGNQTVWLLDEKGEPLVKVRVTRGMTRVEVGKSCRTLDAR
jgi:hypothetical protein